MNVLDLFSGIGGFSLGLERAGMRTVAFCEIDPYCRRVLRKHWPDVPVYGDIRELTFHDGWFVADTNKRHEPADGQLQAGRSRAGQQRIDVICGGFPCQDISVAGKGAGIAGERSGLWSEYARIIGEVRPRYVIVENVAALLGRGLERVLGDLAALGFDAEWHCIPASAVGAPHRRDRVWIVAYAARDVRSECAASGTEWERVGQCGEPLADVADAAGTRWHERSGDTNRVSSAPGSIEQSQLNRASAGLADADRRPLFGPAIAWPERHPWIVEPDVGRVAHGVPARVDRLRALGNAIVPQIAEIIGRAIMSIERDDYDGNDDFTRSIEEAYRVIRERKANGGPEWGGWE
jgi:DNA (cytosine-5)-methyltransferase 1